VTNEKNGRTVRVKVNDRGPFVAGRIVDLSRAAAAEIDAVADGVVPVTLSVVSLGSGRRTRPAKSAGSEAATSWAVQAGAFADAENAERLRERLAERYPGPWLEPYQGLTRVKLGPYRTRGEADDACAGLADFGLAGIVVPYDAGAARPGF
jgi:rare lipoprotein A